MTVSSANLMMVLRRGHTVRCVQRVQQGAQDTSLGDSCVDGKEGWGVPSAPSEVCPSGSWRSSCLSPRSSSLMTEGLNLVHKQHFSIFFLWICWELYANGDGDYWERLKIAGQHRLCDHIWHISSSVRSCCLLLLTLLKLLLTSQLHAPLWCKWCSPLYCTVPATNPWNQFVRLWFHFFPVVIFSVFSRSMLYDMVL